MKKVNQKLDTLSIVILLMLCASWGLQHVAIKVTNRGISPLMQCGIRSLGAGVLVWIWMIIRR